MGGTFREMGWEDRTVKVNRKELLEALKKNRGQHIADYKEACSGYREAALKRIDEIAMDLKKKIGDLKEGKAIERISLSFGLDAPVSHEKAYDQIIRMMEMSVDDAIELTSGQFACFVMDDWEWKPAWTTSNSVYQNKR